MTKTSPPATASFATSWKPMAKGLADKPVVVALNKVDTLDDELTAALAAELEDASGKPVLALSAAGGSGVETVLDALLERLTVQRVEDEGPAEPIEWSPV